MVNAVIQGIRGRGFTFTDLERLSGVAAYQDSRESYEPATLSLAEAWRRSAQGTNKGRLLRFAGLWLASTAAGRKAIREKPDLTAFKARPTKRFLAGVGLILFSYVLGWPMVGLFSFLAAYFQNAGFLIGGPIAFGFSHLVFLAGMVLAGRGSFKYVEIFFLWSLRSLAERLIGQDLAGTTAYPGRGSDLPAKDLH
jgi:hypothetical protein